MCFGIQFNDKGVQDSCEMYNPTMAGSANDQGSPTNTSVVKEFKLSKDGSQAFVRTQAAYYYGAGTPVGSDPQRRPPYNKVDLSNCFVSYWVRIEDPGQTLVIDVGIDVTERPPGLGGQVAVLSNFMPPAFVNSFTFQGGKLVQGPPFIDEYETVWDKPTRLLARSTADGQHCQGIACVSKSSRGQPYLGTKLDKPDGRLPEKRRPDGMLPHLEGRPAFEGGLSHWVSTWHEKKTIEVGGKYAFRVKMPMGTVAEVEAALAAIEPLPFVTY